MLERLGPRGDRYTITVMRGNICDAWQHLTPCTLAQTGTGATMRLCRQLLPRARAAAAFATLVVVVASMLLYGISRGSAHWHTANVVLQARPPPNQSINESNPILNAYNQASHSDCPFTGSCTFQIVEACCRELARPRAKHHTVSIILQVQSRLVAVRFKRNHPATQKGYYIVYSCI